MTLMPVYVSIIIPAKNAGNRLDLVLKGIFRNKPAFGYEVIIVDSGSTDNTKEIIAKYPVRLIEIPPESFSHGGSRNTGAAAARGEILVYLSHDAVPLNEDWLAGLVSGFADPETAGIYGRQIPNSNASIIERFFLQYVYPDREIIKNKIIPDDCILPDILFSDVNSAVRRSEWAGNKFREDIIMSEDQGWSRDMLLQGKKIVYEPRACVCHSHNYTPRKLIMRNFDSGLSLRDIIRAPLKRSIAYELKYIRSAMVYFLNNRAYRYLFILPFYEAARVLGFLLGRHSGFLPVWVKMRLSENKAYWGQQREKSNAVS